jgi:hypothetical protein
MVAYLNLAAKRPSAAPPQPNGNGFNRKERIERKEWIYFSALFALAAVKCFLIRLVRGNAARKRRFERLGHDVRKSRDSFFATSVPFCGHQIVAACDETLGKSD